jgi:O-antigen ligase
MLSLIKNIAPLILYLYGVIVFFLCLFGKPKYGLFFLIPLLPLQNILEKIQTFPLGKDFNDILLIGMLLGLVFYKHAKGQRIFNKSTFNIILFLYVIYTYVTLWSGSSFLGMPAPLSAIDPRVQNWKNYILLFVLFLLSLNILNDKRDITKLFLIMCGAIFIMDLYTTRQISWMGSWVSREKLNGTFVWLGANEVSAFFATYTFILAGIFLLIKRMGIKLLLGFLIFLNLYCVLFIFSRGAYIAVLMAALFISVVKQKKLIIPIVLLLVFWQAILPTRVIERLKFTEQEGQLDRSAQDRIVLWQQSIEFFKQNPITGIGFNVFSHIGLKRDTHNLFLRTLAEQGIIGLMFLLSIMLLAFKRGWRLYKRAQDNFLKGVGLGFCTCVIAVMVGNFFGDRWTHLPLAAYFWVFLGIVERGNIIALSEQRLAHSKNKAKKSKNELNKSL